MNEIKRKFIYTFCVFSYLDKDGNITESNETFPKKYTKKNAIKKIKELYNTDDVIVKMLDYVSKELVLPIDEYIKKANEYQEKLNNEIKGEE